MTEVCAAFLDRDGTIIEEQDYPRDPDKVRLLPRSPEGLQLIQKKGYLLFVISNQSGVGRGIISAAQFKAVHKRCCEVLQAAAVEIAEFVYCFHHPDERCSCRKPSAGLIPKTYHGNKINWSKSIMVGDKRSDVELADNIGASGYLVLTGWGPQTYEELKADGAVAKYRVCEDLLCVAADLPLCTSRD